MYPKCVLSQVLMEMDWQDEQSGRMEEIYRRMETEYSQFKSPSLHGDGNVHQNNQNDYKNTVDCGVQELGNTTEGLID